MTLIKSKKLIYLLITIYAIFFTSCEQNNIIENKNNNSTNTEKVFLDYSKYEQMGIQHNQSLDTIKNDKDFFKIIDNPNILDEIFEKHFKLNYLLNIDFIFDSLNQNIYDYANFMYNSGKITENEYDFCMFVNNFSINVNDSLENEIVLQKINKEIKKYINIISRKEISEKELDNILGGSFVFMYSINYWYREFSDTNSNWSKLLYSKQSKYLDFFTAAIATSKADATAKFDCTSAAGDVHGSFQAGELWDSIYNECNIRAAKTSAFVYLKKINIL